jgi:hypothetical protein
MLLCNGFVSHTVKGYKEGLKRGRSHGACVLPPCVTHAYTSTLERLNNDLYGDNDEDDGDSIATGNVSTWSMDTAQEAIFRKVEADLEAELKAKEDDSDSDEEASTNSDYSLSPEELAVYEATEAEMLEAGTL